MYNFTKLVAVKKGVKSLNGVGVSNNVLVFYLAFLNRYKKHDFCDIFWDGEEGVLGIKMSETNGAFRLRRADNRASVTSKAIMAIPDGRYMFIEKTKEEIDIFRK